MKKIMALAMVLVVLLCGCSYKRAGIRPRTMSSDYSMKKNSGDNSEQYIDAMVKFSLDIFRTNYEYCKDNTVVSPLSIVLALAMTENGATGDTLKEFEELTGCNVDTLTKELNFYLSSLMEDESLKAANSVWYEKKLDISADFVKKCVESFDAQIFSEEFSSATVDKVNSWVKDKTDNKIDSIIDKLDPESKMLLINALSFEAKWTHPFEKENTCKRKFTNTDGNEVIKEFMSSDESGYIRTDDVSAFIKTYKGGKYSFIAMLPDEKYTLEEYIDRLDVCTFKELLNHKSNKSAMVYIPKFKMEYELSQKNVLESLGLNKAFGYEAQFGGMLKSGQDNLFIDDVIHKAYIEVDEEGTKAAAVTAVIMNVKSAAMNENILVFDRPFIYCIYDNEAKLPVFMGTVENL